MEGFECEDNVTVNVQISMSSCQEGTCGSNGRCISYFSSGLIYSTCVCSNGKLLIIILNYQNFKLLDCIN